MRTAITINNAHVNVPSSWDELTYGQYLAIQKANTDAEMMSALTGIDMEVCKLIDPKQIELILLPSTLMGDVELIEDPQIFGLDVPRSIGAMEFARKVNCDSLPRDYQEDEMVGRMVAIYCAEGIEDSDIENAYNRILNEPFVNVVSAGRILSDQLAILNEMEGKIKQPEYDSEEWSAGISDFKKYGVFGLVRGIALRHHCSMEEVYKWSYNSVLLELQYSADENAYQRKLNKILSRK